MMRISGRLLALLLVLMLMPWGALAVEQQRAEEEADLAAQVMEQINERRVKARAEPMMTTAALQEAANIRAREIAESFSTRRPDGGKASTAYDGPWEKFSEFLYQGTDVPKRTVSHFLKDDKRKKIILGKGYTHMAVGVCIPDDIGADDNWDIYYCLLVIRQTEALEDEIPVPTPLPKEE